MRLTFSQLFAAIFVAQIAAAPLPLEESCSCQPIESASLPVQTLERDLSSCQAIAERVQDWRKSALQTTNPADIFVDQESLRQSRMSGLSPFKLSSRVYRYDSTTKGAFAQFDPRPSAAEQQSNEVSFLKHASNFKISCQTQVRDSPAELTMRWFLVAAVVVSIPCLSVFELIVDICTSRSNAAQDNNPGRRAIALLGDEKPLLAYCDSQNDHVLGPQEIAMLTR